MSANSIYLPYFYIIKHIPSGLYYAGSKFGVDANPDNFMKENGYITSNNFIREEIAKYGLSCIQIIKIKTFLCRDEAYNYETRFLQKVNARDNKKFINLHNNDHLIAAGTEKYKKIMMLKHGVEHNMQIPEVSKRVLETKRKNGTDKLSEKQKKKISKTLKSKPKLKCEYCGNKFYKVNYERWHGTHCLENKANYEENLIYRKVEAQKSLNGYNNRTEKAKIETGLKIKKSWENRDTSKYGNREWTQKQRKEVSDRSKQVISNYNPMQDEENRTKVSKSKIGRKRYYKVGTLESIYAKTDDKRLKENTWVLAEKYDKENLKPK